MFINHASLGPRLSRQNKFPILALFIVSFKVSTLSTHFTSPTMKFYLITTRCYFSFCRSVHFPVRLQVSATSVCSFSLQETVVLMSVHCSPTPAPENHENSTYNKATIHAVTKRNISAPLK